MNHQAGMKVHFHDFVGMISRKGHYKYNVFLSLSPHIVLIKGGNLTLFASTSSVAKTMPQLWENGRGVQNWHQLEANRVKDMLGKMW